MEPAPQHVPADGGDGDGRPDSINNTINAYEAGQTQDYQTYWTYRNQQSDDYVGGLTQGQTYYVVVDGLDPTKILLSTTDPSRGRPHTPLLPRQDDPGAGGAEQRLYIGSTSGYVTFDSSSSTIDSVAGTIKPVRRVRHAHERPAGHLRAVRAV